MLGNCSLTGKYYIPLLLPLDIQVRWRSEVCPSIHRNVDLFQLVSLYIYNEMKLKQRIVATKTNKSRQSLTALFYKKNE